jgi:dolichol-phosphate mannosyltransferase
MKIVIVMPTYKEAENLKKIIPAIDTEIKKIPEHEFKLLIVDGNSPDGTAGLVHDLSKQYPFVHLLLEEKKAGLGAAYMYGFKNAIEKFHPDVIVEMDADFQHDPKDLGRLVAPITEGYDYVIGSRFTKGGSIPKDWALYRKFLSIGGNIFTKVVLGIFNVNDFTTGFKASRVKGFVDKIVEEPLLSKGFAYKMDLLFKMHTMGAKIKEIPIVFKLRDEGVSKMQGNNPIDSLKVVLMLRFHKSKHFFKFALVGFTGFCTDMILSNSFRLVIDNPSIAASLAVVFSLMVTFTLNNFWSFGDRRIKKVSVFLRNFVAYIGLSCVPLIFRYWFVGYITSMYGNLLIPYNFALIVSISLGLVWNYIVYSRIIWKKQ